MSPATACAEPARVAGTVTTAVIMMQRSPRRIDHEPHVMIDASGEFRGQPGRPKL